MGQSSAAKVIMVAHLKGGAGKSTISINLAAALKKLGYNVGIFDLDMSTATSFNAQNHFEIYAENFPASERPARTLPPVHKLKIDPSAMPIARRTAVSSQMNPLIETYDYLVVDAGAGATEENMDALQATDLVIVPAVPSTFEVPATFRYIQDIENFIGASGFGRRKLSARVIINKAENTTAMTEQLYSRLRDSASPVKLMTAIIPDRKSLKSLLATGSTVFDRQQRGDLQKIFLLAARECIEILSTDSNRRAAA